MNLSEEQIEEIMGGLATTLVKLSNSVEEIGKLIGDSQDVLQPKMKTANPVRDMASILCVPPDFDQFKIVSGYLEFGRDAGGEYLASHSSLPNMKFKVQRSATTSKDWPALGGGHTLILESTITKQPFTGQYICSICYIDGDGRRQQLHQVTA